MRGRGCQGRGAAPGSHPGPWHTMGLTTKARHKCSPTRATGGSPPPQRVAAAPLLPTLAYGSTQKPAKEEAWCSDTSVVMCCHVSCTPDGAPREPWCQPHLGTAANAISLPKRAIEGAQQLQGSGDGVDPAVISLLWDEGVGVGSWLGRTARVGDWAGHGAGSSSQEHNGMSPSCLARGRGAQLPLPNKSCPWGVDEACGAD